MFSSAHTLRREMCLMKDARGKATQNPQNEVAPGKAELPPHFVSVKQRIPALSLLLLFLHLLSRTEWSHIRPDFFDVGEAFLFRARLAGIVPPEGVFAVGGPDRVLLFVVNDNFVNGFVLSFFAHTTPLRQLEIRVTGGPEINTSNCGVSVAFDVHYLP